MVELTGRRNANLRSLSPFFSLLHLLRRRLWGDGDSKTLQYRYLATVSVRSCSMFSGWRFDRKPMQQQKIQVPVAQIRLVSW